MAKFVAGVLVLGDIGRSPRMQYHSMSFATQAKYSVHIVAYQGTKTQTKEEKEKEKEKEEYKHLINLFQKMNQEKR
jgi:hypothetical protein